MLTRCWLPPDRRPTSSPARSRSPVCSSIRATVGLDVGDLLQAREQAQVLGARRASSRARAAAAPSRPARRSSETVPAVGAERAGEDLQQRRLAGAVGPDDRDQLAAARPRSVTSRSAARVAVALAHPVRAQGGVGHRRHRRRGYCGRRGRRATAASSASPSSVPHAGQCVGAGRRGAPHSGQRPRLGLRLAPAAPRRRFGANDGSAGATAGRSHGSSTHVPAQVDDGLAQDRGDRQRDERARGSRTAGRPAAARRSPAAG